MQVLTYLVFNGRCEEAIEFYKKTLGAQVQQMLRFGDNPEKSAPGCEKIDPQTIMHSTLLIGETLLMASDGMGNGPPRFEGFSLSLSFPTLDEVHRTFALLGDGGQVRMPITKTFFSPGFGMVTDRFGVSWMVLVTPTV